MVMAEVRSFAMADEITLFKTRDLFEVKQRHPVGQVKVRGYGGRDRGWRSDLAETRVRLSARWIIIARSV